MTYQQMQEQAYKFTDKLLLIQEQKILNKYKIARSEVNEVIKNLYVNHLVGVDTNDYYTTLNQYNRLTKANMEIKGIYTSLTRSEYQTVYKGQLNLFAEQFYRQQYATMLFADSMKFTRLNPIIAELSVTGDIEVWKQIRNKALKEDAKVLIPKSGKTLKQMIVDNNTADLVKVQQTVKQGLINGVSYQQQARNMKDVFDSSYSKAIRVARTEGNRNQNASSYWEAEEASKQVDLRRQWLATRDDRTRDRHGELDGQTVGVGEYFEIAGDKALYPGGFGDPAMSINCRCSVIDIIEGLEPTVQRVRNPLTGKTEIASFGSYQAYEEKYLGG